MSKINRVALLGLLFWFVFGLGGIVVILLQLLGIALYRASGNEAIKEWVTVTGEATDCLANAAWFDGDFRETVSSHTGRWFTAKYGNSYHSDIGTTPTQPDLVIPWKFRFVAWLTDKFETDHVYRAIEKPFMGSPL